MGNVYLNYFFLLCVGIIGYCVIDMIIKAPGKALNKRFQQLGNLQGLNYQEIVYSCGVPNSISSCVNNEGKTVKVAQWIKTGYHISLVFDDGDVCQGISHEFLG